MKCDYIAQGIIAATKELELSIPLVVRLEGTNVDLGKKLLNDSGLNITAADSMGDGAQKIVQMVKEAGNESTLNSAIRIARKDVHRMSIYVDKDTKVILQAITGSAGMDHTEQMITYGKTLVGG